MSVKQDILVRPEYDDDDNFIGWVGCKSVPSHDIWFVITEVFKTPGGAANRALKNMEEA